MTPVTHKATVQFWQRFYDLPEHVQQLARKNFALLVGDPRHPSLHFKRIRTRRGTLASARVGIAYRALAVAEDDHYSWTWIGHHSVYDELIK